PRGIEIRSLSTRPDRVSGGDVLVEVVAPADAPAPAVTLNGRDISPSFHAATAANRFVGLVSGLSNGRNTIKVAGKPWHVSDASLAITNYPLTGPIVSGPHVQPFVCQTAAFKLPDGSTLGAPADVNCSAATKVQYVYMPQGAKEFKPLPSAAA